MKTLKRRVPAPDGVMQGPKERLLFRNDSGNEGADECYDSRGNFNHIRYLSNSGSANNQDTSRCGQNGEGWNLDFLAKFFYVHDNLPFNTGIAAGYYYRET